MTTKRAPKPPQFCSFHIMSFRFVVLTCLRGIRELLLACASISLEARFLFSVVLKIIVLRI